MWPRVARICLHDSKALIIFLSVIGMVRVPFLQIKDYNHLGAREFVVWLYLELIEAPVVFSLIFNIFMGSYDHDSRY